MDKIQDYTIIDEIDETNHAILYRCKKEDEEETRFIKVYKAKYSSRADIAQFKYKYEVIRNIDINGVLRSYDLIEHDEQFALIMEDFDGILLKEIISSEKIDIGIFLKIAVSLAKTLSELHRYNIVHKYIKPNNIIVDRENEVVKLFDLGISSFISHESQDFYNSDIIEGTRAYLSPEQTGRNNHVIDYRCDFYSLGMTFYEMLTGHVPFMAGDPLEVIHHQLAGKPEPASSIDASIPDVISNIIEKMTAITVEERYQNGFGLYVDLKKCLGQFNETGKVEDFEIAQNDVALQLNIVPEVVGREHELNTLQEIFSKVSRGSKGLVLVEGEAGIGKSALVHEFHKPVFASRGYFISGAYEKNKQYNPYSAVIQAFQGLLREILFESQERIAYWTEGLKNALGPNGKVISDIIPDIEMIIGEQPDIPELGQEESQNRFRMVFHNLIRVFASVEHPLVLFLDDLHWADSASLKLIKSLIIESEIKYMLIICAYRGNAVDASHIVSVTIDALKNGLNKLDSISVGPLAVKHVTDHIINLLHCKQEDSEKLADIVHEKTRGNPFFINWYLKTLFDENLIEPDIETGWKWDISRIGQMQVADNVVELLEKKIAKLPGNIYELMKACACIGNQFNLELLSALSGKSFDETLSNLDSAIREGYICAGDDIFRFHHNRIQEIVYAVIPEDEKTETHYRLGKIFIAQLPEEELQDKIFYLTHNLNQGILLITDNEEKQNLIHLNMMAGEKAMKSTAYDSAVQYFQAAVDLMPDNPRDEYYDLMIDCYKKLGTAEYLNGNYERSGEIFDTAINKSRSSYDRAGILRFKSIMIASQNRIKDALTLVLEGLKSIGIKVPGKVGRLTVIRELIKTKIKLGNRKPESLIELPEMTDKKMLLATDLIMDGISFAFLGNDTNMQGVLTFRMLQLVLAHGNNYQAPWVYSSYAYVLMAILKDYESGMKYADISLKINERYCNSNIKAQIYLQYGCMCIWGIALPAALEIIKKSFTLSLDTGNIRYAVYAKQVRIYEMFSLGTPLGEIYEYTRKYHNFIIKAGDKAAINYDYSIALNITYLKGDGNDLQPFDPVNITEKELIKKMEKDAVPIVQQRHYMHRALVLYLLGDYTDALEAAQTSIKYLDQSLGQICESDINFYHSLVLAALIKNNDKKSGKYIREMDKNQKLMKKWSEYCPENHLHKYLLIEALIAQIDINGERADEMYCRALKSAREHGFLHDTAIINELYANFFLAKNNEDAAAIFIQNALYGYQKWGAEAKVKIIVDKYSGLLNGLTYQPSVTAVSSHLFHN